MTTRSKGSELLQTDQHAYRACILYEVMHNKSVEEAYKNMKEVRPNVDFLDFDYWYYRFLNGNVDLDYDRSKDPKTRGFSDMPIDVVENIVGNLGLVDKLSSRKVCRNLRAVIDNQTSEFKSVKIYITDKLCETWFVDQIVKYSGRHETQKDTNWFMQTHRKTISLTGGDPWMMAMKDFSSVITNQKWSFEKISIVFACANHRIDLFNSMVTDHKIHVKKLRIVEKSLDQVIDMIPIFDADILESIDFAYSDFEREPMEKLLKTDQWKNAKTLKFSHFPNWFPIESLLHCKEFKITKQEETNLGIVFYKIRDILFKSPTFDSCVFSIEVDRPQRPPPFDGGNWGQVYHQAFEFGASVDRVMGEHAAYDIENRRYHIEGSNDYFEISCESVGNYTFELAFKRVHN